MSTYFQYLKKGGNQHLLQQLLEEMQKKEILPKNLQEQQHLQQQQIQYNHKWKKIQVMTLHVHL